MVLIMRLQNQASRQQLLTHIISKLEAYKSKHGIYPAQLKSINTEDNDWIYYTTDSKSQYYNLSYPESVMNMNTVSYDSRTKVWTKMFNY